MAKIVKTHLGKYCYIWVKGQRVPMLGVIGYNIRTKDVTLKQIEGDTLTIHEREVAWIMRAC